MLLIARRARNTRDDSKDCAESVVDAVDCIRHPAATASVPAFAFQNCIEKRLAIWGAGHGIERACVCFFLQSTGAQEFLYILLARERAIALRRKLALVFFLSRLHSANGDVGAERARESSLESRPESVGQCWDRLTH